MRRPRSIAEIAERAAAGAQLFDPGVREFIDAWQLMLPQQREAAVTAEPVALGDVKDAYLGALAEYLMACDRKFAPTWTEKPERFLREPFFAGGLESLKAILIVESPSAFRRRLIFISADGLSRPHRAMTDGGTPTQ